jgi:hypothetical protein
MAISPVVAAIDNEKDGSKTTRLSCSQPAPREAARMRLGKTWRPLARTPSTAHSIQAARQAEPLPPAKSA